MQHSIKIVPQPASGETQMAVSPFTDKAGYAQRWGGSKRWLDGLLAAGLPHLKIGKRRVRISVFEADNWMLETFRVQRRGRFNGGAR